MKTVKGQPITAGRAEYSKKRPFVPDAKETSANEETMIKEAPQPFKNKLTAANQPAASKAPGGVSTLEPRIQSGLKRTTPGVKALPSGSAVGYSKLPNQGNQIGGRMGFPPPSKKRGDNGSGYPAKKNAKFYGE